MEKPILIVASSIDDHAYVPVCEKLDDKGFESVVYRTDKVLSEEESFALSIDNEGTLTIAYNGRPIGPDNVSAAWFRKLGSYTLPGTEHDRAKQLYIRTEVSQLHDTVWSLYDNEIWLNSPENIRQSDRKLDQLLLAKKFGFSIPDTVVTNEWEAITDRLMKDKDDQVVVKMVRGIISEQNKLKALYTKPLSASQVKVLKGQAQPFPGIYQPFLDKAKEWRVTVVGDRVFPAAIYTDQSAKDDWRKHQTTNAVTFVYEELPMDFGERCVKYLGQMGLKFGCFDFIETEEGETIFLECNPNGQYGWLEQSLGFPISDSIATELIEIAKTNSK